MKNKKVMPIIIIGIIVIGTFIFNGNENQAKEKTELEPKAQGKLETKVQSKLEPKKEVKEEPEKEVVKEEVVESKEVKNISKSNILEVKSHNEGIMIVFDLHKDIDLGISSKDDIFIKVIDKANNNVIVEKNKTYENYILNEGDKTLGTGSVLNPGTYSVAFTKAELNNMDVNNVFVELSIQNDGSDIYNQGSSISSFEKEGHVDIKPISPDPHEFGVRYKWQLSNNTGVKTNVKITNFLGNEYLTGIDLNPGEVISVYTSSHKGDKIKLHTRQADNSYKIKDVFMDYNVIGFDKVVAESVKGDSSTNGNVIRWKVKNPNANAKANVIIKDSVGGFIMQFDLDANNEKIVDIPINRGRSIVVETRMANGSYVGDNYVVDGVFEKVSVGFNVLEVVESNGVKTYKVEIENLLDGRTNVIISTADNIHELHKFDMNKGDKRVVNIDGTYVKSVIVKTRQFDGSYEEGIHDL